jgi:hypothetical protein
MASKRDRRREPIYRQDAPNRESTGNFLGIGRLPAKNRVEDICEFSQLQELRDLIPCATEQGI